jgi:CRP-like cAMP-binding protein
MSALHARLVVSTGAARHMARNETIFDQDDRSDRFFKLIAGTVRLCRHLPSGRRQIVEFAMPGDLIGLVDNPYQTLAAEAVTPATVIGFSRDGLEHSASGEPALRSDICVLYLEKLRDTQRHVCLLGHSSAKQRLAAFLLRMADRLVPRPDGSFELPMPRLDVADHLGLTIETVSRAVGALKKDGLVCSTAAQRFILCDTAALRALVSEA